MVNILKIINEEINTRITDKDKNNCWEWLKKLLEKLVDERHEMLNE